MVGFFFPCLHQRCWMDNLELRRKSSSSLQWQSEFAWTPLGTQSRTENASCLVVHGGTTVKPAGPGLVFEAMKINYF